MQISSRFTIGIHICLCIDYFSSTHKVTSQFLSESIGVNPVIIRNILSQLKNADIITVRKGTGGSSLNKESKNISLLDIYKAVDSTDEHLFHFHERPSEKCPVGSHIHDVLDTKLEHIQYVLEEELASTTLDMLDKELIKILGEKE